MKTLLISGLFIMAITYGSLVFAQPLNGSYTIGGQSPDFATLQDAADSLNVLGVSGPTFFNIRPGTYMSNGGNNTVLSLNTPVTGLSSENRITFQTDANEGANAGNVKLQMNITDATTANRELVIVGLDFISFNNITFQESDASLHISFSVLVQLRRTAQNLTIDGIVFDGCRFIGTQPSAGTENGIELGEGVGDLTVRRNTFLRLLRGISGVQSTGLSQGTFRIEDNQFLAGWKSASGSGNQLGSAMEVWSENLIVQRNIIDFDNSFNSGFRGIFVTVNSGAHTIILEQNSIHGSVQIALSVAGQSGVADSFIVANNMINTSGSASSNEDACGIRINQNANNAKIFFNTIVMHGFGPSALYLNAENCTVLNNIIILKPTGGFSACYVQGSSTSTNFQSDYNVIYNTQPDGILVIRNSDFYFNILDYQAATDLDTNSISKIIAFIAEDDLHLTDCQAQDPDLEGTPISEITVDIDEEIRPEIPMIGADENEVRMLDMFADPYSFDLSGTALSSAIGDFDEDGDDDIAVADNDNNHILLFKNLAPARSFELTLTLLTVAQPHKVIFYDFDEDGHLDIIAGGDGGMVVFWGDGNGNINGFNQVEAFGRVRSFDIGPTFIGDIKRTVAIVEDNGFVANESYLGYLMHLGNRELCHDVQYVQQPSGFFDRPDTIPYAMTDLVVGEFAGDGGLPEIAAITSDLNPPILIIHDIGFLGSALTPCADVVPRGDLTTLPINGYLDIFRGDFDGDGDLDLVASDPSDFCTFIRNEGNLNFSPEYITVSESHGVVAMDYENDGDLDFVSVNRFLQTNGITVMLNDGTGSFTARENCFLPFAEGNPFDVGASDFDKDGKTDIAILSGRGTTYTLYVLYNLGGGIVSIPNQEINEIPDEFTLEQNYPNPFNPSTTIHFSISKAEVVTLKIYNILGEEIKTLVNEYKEAGNHTIQFNAISLSSGIYFYKLQAGSFVQTKKMIVLR